MTTVHDLAPLIAVKPPESTGYVWLQDGAARTIATVWAALSDVPAGAQAQADADLIVRVVNSHHAVLDTLKVLAYRLRVDGRTADGITKEAAATLCEAAIAKAEGRS